MSEPLALDKDQKQNSFVLKRLIVTTLIGSSLNLTRLLTGLIRIKYIAVAIGFGGVGLIAQGTQIQLLLGTIGSLGITVGIISRLKERGEDFEDTLKTAFTLQFMSCGITLVIALLASKYISHFLFGTPGATLNAMLIVISIPFYVLSSNYMEAIFFWKDRYDLYVKASIYATLVGFTSTLVLIYFYGLQGAFGGILVTGISMFIAFFVGVSKVFSVKHLFHFGIKKSELVYLWKVSFVMFFSSFATYGTQWALRRGIIDNFGVDFNGLIQVPSSISNYYMPFVVSSIWAHFHPSISEKGYGQGSLLELGSVLKFIGCLSLIAIVVIMIAPEILIYIAYSEDFLKSIQFLPAQLFGDWLHVQVLVMSVFFLGVVRLKHYIALWLLYFGSYLVVGTLFIYNDDPLGYYYGYILSGLATFTASLWWLSGKIASKDLLVITCLTVVSLLLIGLQGMAVVWAEVYFYRLLVPVVAVLLFLAFVKFLKEGV